MFSLSRTVVCFEGGAASILGENVFVFVCNFFYLIFIVTAGEIYWRGGVSGNIALLIPGVFVCFHLSPLIVDYPLYLPLNLYF